MPSPLIIATLAGSLMGNPAPVVDAPMRATPVSGDCGPAALQVVADTGGELLSVQPTSDGQCVVTVLIPGNGGRPKKVTLRVSM
jgi:hypothetical protein